MNTETYPDLIETLSFLKFPDEKHLLYFSDSDSESSNSLPYKTVDTSNKDEEKTFTEKSLDLLLSCTFNEDIVRRQGNNVVRRQDKKENSNIYNDVFTESLSSKKNSVKSKKSSIKSKKSSIKSKKSSVKSKKSSIKSKKSSIKSKKSSVKSKKNSVKSKKSYVKSKKNSVKSKKNSVKSKKNSVKSKRN